MECIFCARHNTRHPYIHLSFTTSLKKSVGFFQEIYLTYFTDEETEFQTCESVCIEQFYNEARSRFASQTYPKAFDFSFADKGDRPIKGVY